MNTVCRKCKKPRDVSQYRMRAGRLNKTCNECLKVYSRNYEKHGRVQEQHNPELTTALRTWR